MGLTSSSPSWYIYGRDKQDYWLPNHIDMSVAQETNELFHIGRFKHQVFFNGIGLGTWTCTQTIFVSRMAGGQM